MSGKMRHHHGDLKNALRQLIEASWAYVDFALCSPDHFRITLSGVVEQEGEYPGFAQISAQSLDLVLAIVRNCQGRSDVLAVSVWSMVHGFALLVLGNQVPPALRDRYSLKEMLVFALSQIVTVDIDPTTLAST